jgi:hypothetical protein
MSEMDTRKLTAAVIFCIFAIFMAIGSWRIYEYFTLTRPMSEIFTNNPELKGIRAEIKYKSFLNDKDIIFNLKHISEPQKITPFILFAELARDIHYREYRNVYIQYRGKTKFVLNGNDFSNLGIKAQLSPVEDICVEFPPLLKRIDGLKPYNQPYGDEQWVTQKKIKNFQDFLYTWYLNDFIASKQKKKKIKTDTEKRPEKENVEIKKTVDGLVPEIDISEIPVLEEFQQKEEPKKTKKTDKNDVFSPDYIPMIEPE